MSHNQIQLELPADFKYLNILSACIRAMLERVAGLAQPELLIYNIQLAVHETSTNIVRHAYANQPNGRIRVSFAFESSPPSFVVELYDTGKSFQPDDVPDPDLNELRESGLGLFLIRELMDEVSYSPQPGHNLWRLVKNL